MRFKNRLSDDRGAVLIIVASFMVVLLTLSAGGIMLFTLYGANREMQKAADQAALAGAASLPLLDPGVLTNGFPVAPLLDTTYSITDSTGLDIPRIGSVPDPKAVACAYGTHNLKGSNAHLIGVFGAAPDSAPATVCASAPWSDVRVFPTVHPNNISNCLGGVVSGVTSRLNSVLGLGGLLGLLGISLDDIMAPVVELQDSLNKLAPALMTPTMTVEVHSGVEPPLLSFITGSNGVQMAVTATARRQLKNAIVLPDTGELVPGLNLNTALAMPRDDILETLDTINNQLNQLMVGLPGLESCQNVLVPLRNDIADLYNPPDGGGPPIRQVIDDAVLAADTAVTRGGPALNEMAGEAFLVISGEGSTQSLNTLLNIPLISILAPALRAVLESLQIPALDVGIVAAHEMRNGIMGNDELLPNTFEARGLFTATLVK